MTAPPLASLRGLARAERRGVRRGERGQGGNPALRAQGLFVGRQMAAG
jgi:hypothetical protein